MASWASIAKVKAAKQASGNNSLAITAAKDGLRLLVVDANAIIDGLRLEGIADQAATIQEVLDEIRDKQARQFMASLPYELQVAEPSEESLKAVTKFARATGDVAALSSTDIKLMALAHTLEVAAHGTQHLLTHPNQPRMHNRTAAFATQSLPGWGSVPNPEDWRAVDEANDADEAALAAVSTSRIAQHVQQLSLDPSQSNAFLQDLLPSSAAPLTPSAISTAAGAAAAGTAAAGAAAAGGGGGEGGPAGAAAGSVAAVPATQAPREGISATAAGATAGGGGHAAPVVAVPAAMQSGASAGAAAAAAGAGDVGDADAAAAAGGGGDDDDGGWEVAAVSKAAARHRKRKAVKKQQHQAAFEQEWEEHAQLVQQQQQQQPPEVGTPPQAAERATPAAPAAAATAATTIASDGASPAADYDATAGSVPTAAAIGAEAECESDGDSDGEGSAGQQAGDGKQLIDPEDASNDELLAAEHCVYTVDADADDQQQQQHQHQQQPAEVGEAAVAAEAAGSSSSAAITHPQQQQQQQQPAGPGSRGWQSSVAIITGDFAMQNVLLQMGLRLLTKDGRRIARLSRYALRCSACFTVTREPGRLFCPKCGNLSLDRVEVVVGADGVEYFGMQKRHILRGTRYSLPKPKGGRQGDDLVLREDVFLQKVKALGKWPTKKSVAADDDDDTDAAAAAGGGEVDPFAPNSSTDRWHVASQQELAQHRGLAAVLQPSWKHNPNERKLTRSNRRG